MKNLIALLFFFLPTIGFAQGYKPPSMYNSLNNPCDYFDDCQDMQYTLNFANETFFDNNLTEYSAWSDLYKNTPPQEKERLRKCNEEIEDLKKDALMNGILAGSSCVAFGFAVTSGPVSAGSTWAVAGPTLTACATGVVMTQTILERVERKVRECKL